MASITEIYIRKMKKKSSSSEEDYLMIKELEKNKEMLDNYKSWLIKHYICK